MVRRSILGLCAASALGLALLAGGAVAQQKTLRDQLVGTWVMVSNITTRADGTKADTFGPNVKAMAIYDGDGHVASVTTRSDLPKFASNNRGTGTADENKAIVGGSLAHFGTYAVNEADKSFTYRIESATFPNWMTLSRNVLSS